jgi:hypothetical protein
VKDQRFINRRRALRIEGRRRPLLSWMRTVGETEGWSAKSEKGSEEACSALGRLRVSVGCHGLAQKNVETCNEPHR